MTLPESRRSVSQHDDLNEADYEIFDLSAPPDRPLVATEPWHGEKFKAEGGHRLAKGLLWLFAGSVGLILFIALVIASRSDSPEQAKTYSEAIIPLLEVMIKFSSSLFAPLFAFIFGYYFSSGRHD